MTPEELDFGDSNYADDSIKVIAKLKEEITQANHRYADLQNVCDDQEKEIERLRAVAGAFQPGDAEMIKSMADRIMGVMLQSDAEKACLRRLQAAAEEMER